MRMFIPDIGYAIKLNKDWTFALHFERRNQSLLLEAGVIDKSMGYGLYQDKPPIQHTLKAGTSLVVERVYIRQGLSGFSSVSFTRKADKATKTAKARFWAKLEDVNELEFERDEEAQHWAITLAEALKKAEDIQLVTGVAGMGFAPGTQINFTPKTTESLENLRGKAIVVTKKGTRAELRVVSHVLQNLSERELPVKDGMITVRAPGDKYFRKFVDPKDVIGFGEPVKS